MDVLFRVVRRSPTVFSSFKRHHKLHDKWGENLDTVDDGLTFYLKYLGSTLVEEISEGEGESYGDGISTKAIQRVISMEKSSGKKWRKVALNVSSQGIKMYNMITKEMLLDVCIYRISFCTADRHHERVFAFIARNTINETMECYVYVCPKRKIAHDVTLTVSQSFSIAECLELEEEREERRKAEKEDNRIYVGELIEIPDDDLMPSYRRKLSDSVTSSDASTPMNLSPPSNSPCINLQDFDEEEANLDDCFSRLAEYRSGLKPTPFTTDFIKADIENDVGHYLKNNNRCLEDYVCPQAVENLLLL